MKLTGCFCFSDRYLGGGGDIVSAYVVIVVVVVGPFCRLVYRAKMVL